MNQLIKALIIITLTSLSGFAGADHKKSDSSHFGKDGKHKKEQMPASIKKKFHIKEGMDVAILINGMACGGCQKRVAKHFKKKSKVFKKVDVSFDERTIWLKFQSGKSMTDAELTKEVGDAGYHVEKILKRS